MNSQYLNEYINVLERVFSFGYKHGYSTSSIEKLVSYSPFFQAVERDNDGFAPIMTDIRVVNDFFPNQFNDLSKVPVYNQCLWAAESFLRIQGKTGLTFECIFLYIPINKMYEYFPLYHEMDFSHIIKEFERLHSEKSPLGVIIEKYHYSLTEIAKRINVSYDMLSSLKRRKRDIKKANVELIVKLSQVLHVRVETIAEIRFLND